MPTRRHAAVSVAAATAAACLPAAPALAGGQPAWTLTVGPGGTTSGTGTVDNDLTGFLIGDFDERSNPDGTSTLPGIFGGSGNQPVDLDAGFDLGGSLDGTISGGLRIVGDPEGGEIAIESLDLDLLSGATSVFPITATLVFETFRSVNPDSLFPGGFPVEIPLAEAEIVRFDALQAGSASSVVSPNGPDSYLLTVDVPVFLIAEFVALGQSLELPPVPAIVSFAGELNIGPDGGATVALTSSAGVSQIDEGPFTDPVLEGVPFDLPTVLPPGSVAGVLFTLTPQSVASELSFALSFDAAGPADAPGLTGDVNGDGAVDFADILLVLAAFGSCDPGAPCPADVDRSGDVAFGDLLLVLANWTG
jgi:hypothetical protein